MTYRRIVLQRDTPQRPKTPTLIFKPLTKQNHNVSRILYKPQRLHISSRPPGTPKQPPYPVRSMVPETFQTLPGKTAIIPVPTYLLKLMISQISQISQSLHRFSTSPKPSSLRQPTIPSIKISRHLTAPCSNASLSYQFPQVKRGSVIKILESAI